MQKLELRDVREGASGVGVVVGQVAPREGEGVLRCLAV